MDRDKNILMEKELFVKEWEMNMARIVEAIILLDLMQTINNKSYNIMDMNMTIAMDNKEVWKMIHGGMKVPNYYNQDAIAKVSAIERITQ